MSLSVVISTKNAAKTLERALKSASFADEIVVADMSSSDDTVKIAQKYSAKILTVPTANHAEPGRAQALAAATCDWTLVIDADEVISSSLKKKLTEIMNDPHAANGYYLPRKNIIFGAWIRHTGWWPDHILRFFKTGTGTWPQHLHSMPEIAQPVETLEPNPEHAIEHYNYPKVSDFIDRLNRYTSIQAQEEHDQGKNARLSQEKVWQRFTEELCRRFFKFEGKKDGVHGSILSLLQSASEVTAQAKVWELEDKLSAFSPDEERALYGAEYLRSSLSYWIADSRVKTSSGIYKIYWKLRRRLKV